MQQGRITYNLNHSKLLFKLGGIDSVAMYYLFKTNFSNSIIYNPSVKLLYHSLKATKIISRSFKYKRFTDTFNVLLKNDFIEFDQINNHYVIRSINENKGFYKSNISYTKRSITWNDIVEALIKEELKYTKFRQEKAINLRDKIAKAKKAYKLWRRLYKKGLLSGKNGESFTEGILFTYRGIADKVGLSIRTVFNHTRSLVAKGEIRIITVKEVGDILPCSLDYIKDTINCYCYIDNHNRLVKVLGSRILEVK